MWTPRWSSPTTAGTAWSPRSTRDLDAALRYVDQCGSGMVKLNAPTTGVDFHLPFGGERDSGYGGREQGKAALQFYTSSRTVQLAASS